MQYTIAAIVLTATLIAGLCLYVLRVQQPLLVQSDFGRAKASLRERIDTLGPEAAYEEFKTKNPSTVSTALHVSAHLFGTALYEYFKDQGTPYAGLVVCDAEYAYACFHEYVAYILREDGLEALNALAPICKGVTYAACAHGVGHGLLEYVGGDNLVEAVGACKKLGGQHAFACQRGVFMDYNSPLATSTLTPDARPLTLENRFSPCDSKNIPEEYQYECYGSLPAWWLRPDISLETIGEWCMAVPMAYTHACFDGVGVGLPAHFGYDGALLREKCEIMPSAQAVAWCQEGSLRTASATINSCKPYEDLGLPRSACPL